MRAGVFGYPVPLHRPPARRKSRVDPAQEIRREVVIGIRDHDNIKLVGRDGGQGGVDGFRHGRDGERNGQYRNRRGGAQLSERVESMRLELIGNDNQPKAVGGVILLKVHPHRLKNDGVFLVGRHQHRNTSLRYVVVRHPGGGRHVVGPTQPPRDRIEQVMERIKDQSRKEKAHDDPEKRLHMLV